VYPQPVLDVINPAVDHTMQQVGTHDPAPTVPSAAGGGQGETNAGGTDQ
jgi:NADH-quinone oxidoreductase subunit M